MFIYVFWSVPVTTYLCTQTSFGVFVHFITIMIYNVLCRTFCHLFKYLYRLYCNPCFYTLFAPVFKCHANKQPQFKS